MMKIPISKNGASVRSFQGSMTVHRFYFISACYCKKIILLLLLSFLPESLPTSGLLFLSSMLHTDHTYHTDDLLSPETAGLWTWLLSLLQDGEGSADFIKWLIVMISLEDRALQCIQQGCIFDVAV